MSEREATIIRASALSSYPDCNRRGAARLFRREIQAAGFRLRRPQRGIGAVIGVAVLSAAAATLEVKAKTGELPPADVATEIALAVLNDELRGSGDIVFEPPTHNRNEAARQVTIMSRAYHRTIAPAVHPIVVEERLETEIAPGLVLSGQPDVVAREPQAIRDLKTGTRTPGSHAPQIGGYGLLARANGLDIDTAAVDFIKRVPAHRPQPDPISKPVAIAQAETAATNVIKHIEGDLKTFREGDPDRRILPGDPWSFQANPASILCHPKYCPAFCTEFCREGDPDKLKDL